MDSAASIVILKRFLGFIGYYKPWIELLQQETTIWQGLRIGHPADWELALVSGPGAPGRCAFVDRHIQRMDVHWRRQKTPIDLELLLSNHRKQDADVDISDLSHLPEGWEGLIRKHSGSSVTHAARFFPDDYLIVEVAIIWPEEMDSDTQNAILDEISPVEVDEEGRQSIRAFGLSVRVPKPFRLRSVTPNAGCISMKFSTEEKKGPELTLERIALPSQIKTQTVRDWLILNMPEGFDRIRDDLISHGTHRKESVTSRGKCSMLSTWRGIYGRCLDVAWICPIEERLYHIRLQQTTAEEAIHLPDGLDVDCCKPVPVLRATSEAGQ